MLKTTLKFSLFFVGVPLILGVAFLITKATHDINDQDASFALALLVHYMHLPTIWVFEALGVSTGFNSVLIILEGIVQWAIIAVVLAAIYCGIRSVVSTDAGEDSQDSGHAPQ